MVLRRVASDILPTKEKLIRFFPSMDPNCPLCDASPESSLHLFVFCQAARSLWAGNEHFDVLIDVPLVSSRAFVYSWNRPEQGAVKINCDAAVGLDHSFIAIVARDWRGDLIFSLSKWVETNLPLQAEAKAINLATCVAVNCGFENVVVESDAKTCIEALEAPIDAVPWRISTITADTLSWAFCGQQFIFRWSPRESNKAAHVLASWCLGKNLSGCFGQGYAPSPFMDVINLEHLNVLVAV